MELVTVITGVRIIIVLVLQCRSDEVEMAVQKLYYDVSVGSSLQKGQHQQEQQWIQLAPKWPKRLGQKPVLHTFVQSVT